MKHHDNMHLLSDIPNWGIAKPYKMAVRNRDYFVSRLKTVVNGTLPVEFMQVFSSPYCLDVYSGVLADSFNMADKKLAEQAKAW